MLKGLNFATNNYLGLAHQSRTIQMGIEAGEEFGVNSAGSPLAFGATKYFELDSGITHSFARRSESF